MTEWMFCSGVKMLFLELRLDLFLDGSLRQRDDVFI